jgi:hypothetical protein
LELDLGFGARCLRNGVNKVAATQAPNGPVTEKRDQARQLLEDQGFKHFGIPTFIGRLAFSTRRPRLLCPQEEHTFNF